MISVSRYSHPCGRNVLRVNKKHKPVSSSDIFNVVVNALRLVSIRRRLQAWREKFFVSLFSFMRGGLARKN